jgi:uncharacterized protein
MGTEIIDRIVALIEPEKIIMFGSRAKGNNTEDSDVDLLILKEGVNNRRQYTQKLYKDLMPINIALDIIIDTPENFEKHKKEKSFIYYQIDKTGILIYEKKK